VIPVRVFLSRLLGVVWSGRRHREIDEEMAAHLAEAADDFVRQGLSPDEAQLAARRTFGGVTQAKEVYHQQGTLTWLDELPRDLRYGVRTLRTARRSRRPPWPR
jgi:hypothetical protein